MNNSNRLTQVRTTCVVISLWIHNTYIQLQCESSTKWIKLQLFGENIQLPQDTLVYNYWTCALLVHFNLMHVIQVFNKINIHVAWTINVWRYHAVNRSENGSWGFRCNVELLQLTCVLPMKAETRIHLKWMNWVSLTFCIVYNDYIYNSVWLS